MNGGSKSYSDRINGAVKENVVGNSFSQSAFTQRAVPNPNFCKMFRGAGVTQAQSTYGGDAKFRSFVVFNKTFNWGCPRYCTQHNKLYINCATYKLDTVARFPENTRACSGMPELSRDARAFAFAQVLLANPREVVQNCSSTNNNIIKSLKAQSRELSRTV